MNLYRWAILICTFVSIGVLGGDNAWSQNPDASPRDGILRGDLVRAVAQRDGERVKSLLRQGADINENIGTPEAPITPLLVAIEADPRTAIDLFEKGADPHVFYRKWTTWDLSRGFNGPEHPLTNRLRIALDPATKPQVPDLSLTVWVANGLSHLSESQDDGTALGLAYIAASYLYSPASVVNGSALLVEAEKIRQKVDNLRTTGASGTAIETNATLPQLLDVILKQDGGTWANAARTEVVRMLLAGSDPQAGGGFTGVPIGVAQRIGNTDCIDRGAFRVRVLEASHRAGKVKPETAQIIDQFARAKFNASVTDGWEAIHRANSKRFAPDLDQILHSIHGVADQVAKIKDNVDQLRSSWNSLQRTMSGKIRNTIRSLEQTNGASSNGTERDDEFLPKVEASLHVVTSLVRFADHGDVLASQIDGVGKAGIAVYTSVDQFKHAIDQGLLKPGNFNLKLGLDLASNLMNVASAIANVLGLGGPSMDQVILQQIQEMRADIHHLRDEMRAHFKLVEEMLGNVLDALDTGFERVDLQIQAAREDIRSVAFELGLIDRLVRGQESAIRDYIDIASERDAWTKIQPWLERQKRSDLADGLPMFDDALSLLLTMGTKNAYDPISTGLTKFDQIQDASALANALSDMPEGDYSRHIAILQFIAKNRFAQQSRFVGVKLANPVEWSLASEAYVAMLLRYPEYGRYTSVDELDRLLKVGQEWREAQVDLCEHVEFFKQLSNYYSDQATNFRQVGQEAILNWQKENVPGFDLWAGSLQLPIAPTRARFKVEKFSIRSLDEVKKFDRGYDPAKHQPSDWDLAAPPELADANTARSVIHPAFLNAHLLGLGNLKISYKNLKWEAYREEPRKGLSEVREFGKASVQVDCTLEFEDNVKLLVSSRRLTSKDEYAYGIRVYTVTPLIFVRSIPKGWERVGPVIRRILWANGNTAHGGTGGWPDVNDDMVFADHLKSQWPEMKGRFAQSPELIPPTARDMNVKEAVRRVEMYLRMQQRQLDAELYKGLRGIDGRLPRVTEGGRRLDLARKLLVTLLDLAIPRSVREQPLRGILDRDAVDIGKTSLLDSHLMVSSYDQGRLAIFDLIRSHNWLDDPNRQLLDALVTRLQAKEPQPVIEATCNRLEEYRRLHIAILPDISINEVLKELQDRRVELARPVQQ